MKFLNHNLFTGDITVNGTTTLSTATGVTRATGDNTTHLATTAFVKAQDYATNTALGNYVPVSRTLTINGVTLDLSANRSWTIATSDYTSTLKHTVKAGVAITKGQAVYVTSADGTNMIVGLASNTSEATSSKTMGLAETTVAANGFTNVITEGLLAGLDTSTAGTEGDPVWLGVNGNLIYGLLNKPYAPAHLVFIGIVTRKNANNGEIFVKVQNGFELNEIHDVDLKTVVPVNGHILGFDGTLWINKTIAGWLGYTPANASGTTNYVSKFTGTTTLGNSLIYDNGTGVGIGTTDITAGLHVNYSAANTLLLQRISDDSGPPEAIGRKARGTLNAKTGVTANDRLWFFAAAGYIGTEGVDGAWSSNKVGMNFVASENWTSAAQGTHITWATTEIGQTTRTDKMILTGAGNLGIGTASPSYKLQVNAAGEGLYVIGANTAPYTQTIASFVYGGNSNSINIENQAGKASIQARAGASTMDLLLNPVAGNVGIGTGNPSNKLQVANGDMSITSGYSFILADTDTNWRLGRNIITPVESVYLNSNTFEFVAANASDQGWQFINDDGYPVLEIGAATGSRNVWVNAGNLLVPTGSVGIGTTSPAQKLHVVGNTTITGVTYTDIVQTYSGASIDFRHQDASVVVRVDTANARVGIGTTTPAEKLDIYGNLNFSLQDGVSISAKESLIFNLNSQNNQSGRVFNFRNYTSSLVVIQQAGNVGIGETAPDFKLVVTDTNNYKGILVNGSNAPVIAFDKGVGQTAEWKVGISGNDGESFSVSSGTSNTDRFFISSSGNVGIGTTSPTSKLQVSGNIDATGVISQTFWTNDSIRKLNSGASLNFRTAAGPIEMVLDGSGNLGIGQTSPSSRIDVLTPASATGRIDVFNSLNVGNNTLKISHFGQSHPSAPRVNQIAVLNAEQHLHLVTDSAANVDAGTSTLGIMIRSGGNVGIGTTSPGTKLDVNGVITATGGNSTNWNTAYGWGNHASVGYLTSLPAHTHDDRYYTESESDSRFVNVSGDTMNGSLSFDAAAVIKKRITGVGDNPVKTASGVLASRSDNGGGATYYIIETNVPQNDYQMGGFTIELLGNYGDTNSKTKIDLGGYWNPEGNGGFQGFEAHGTNPQYKPTIQVARNNNTGNTAFIISGVSWSYPVIVARDLWLGYNSTDGGSYGEGWVIASANNIDSYSNRDTVVWRNAYSDSNPAGYITGYSETDTLATVTGRGATTNTAVTFNGGATISGTGGDGSEVLRLTGSASDGFNYSTASVWGNLTAGETVAHVIGKAESQYNTANFGYRHVADGSPSNHVTIGMFQADNLLNILGNGNVGIGTTSPGYKLDVAGDINFTSTLKFGGTTVLSNAASDVYGNIRVLYSASSIADGMYINYNSSGGTGADLRLFANGTNERVRIKADSGNIGIGITSPANKLSIGSTQDGGIDFLYDGFNNYKNQIKNYWNSGTDTRMDFNIGNSSGVTPVTIMSVGYGGNVGIGTTAPDTPLFVQGGLAGTGGWNRTATLSATYPGLIFNSNGTKWGGMAYDYSAAMRFWVNASNNDIFAGTLAMSILNNGNVGIGDTTPSTKLVVNGVITATGGTSTNWNTAFGWGNHASQGYATTGYVDTAIANLVDTAPDALDTLNELAAALGDDPNFATTVTNSIAGKVSKSGDTMTGNLTTTGLTVGNGVATGRQPYGPLANANIVLNSSTSDSSGVCGIEFLSGNNYPSDGASIYFQNNAGGSSERAKLTLRVENDQEDFIELRAGKVVINANTYSGGGQNPAVVFQHNDTQIASITSGGQIDASGGNSSQWNTAYGWGNHSGLYLPIGGGNATGWVSFSSSTQGTPIIKAVQQDSSSGYYLFQGVTGSSEVFRVERTGNIVTSGTLSASGYNKSNWDAAHSWGNHADYGYWNTDLADPKTVQSTDVIFAGNVTVQGTFTESSSIRFKENIVDLESSTEKVEQLRPVRYNKIGVEEEEIGLIAEEVAEIYPEVVTYNEEGQPSGVNYTRLSVILLKSVQELAERVNKLENK